MENLILLNQFYQLNSDLHYWFSSLSYVTKHGVIYLIDVILKTTKTIYLFTLTFIAYTQTDCSKFEITSAIKVEKRNVVY